MMTTNSRPRSLCFEHADVRVEFDGVTLVLENARLSRTLNLSTAMPRTSGLIDKASGFEYAASDREDQDFSFLGYNMPHHGKTDTDFALTSGDAVHEPASPIMPEHVTVRLDIHEAIQKLDFIREYSLFPDQPFMVSRAAIRCPVLPNIYWTRRGDLYKNGNCGVAEYPSVDPSVLESSMDSVKLIETPERTRFVEFFARTDYTDDIVKTTDVEPTSLPGRHNGNICHLALPGGHGLFFLQEAPHGNERRDFESFDFRFADNAIHSLCWGIQPHEVDGDDFIWGYRHVLGLFDGDEVEATRAVKLYQAHRFPKVPDRDGAVLVNPWGCGKFISLMNETFLKEEIKGTAAVGATHYQIDDGWEKGGSLKEFTTNNRASEPEFWDVDPTMLPGGFDGLIDAAKENDVELALWLAPSSNRELRDWEAFADMILAFHKTYGFRHFKLDGTRVKTKLCEDNQERLLRKIRLESNGEIVADFDVTNGQRQGFLLHQEFGILFLANRYVCHNWGMLYHPEITLHNFWQFSRYLRPQNLQVEVTDPGIINHDYYRAKGVAAPDAYDPEYWAALTLFGNPLLWLSPSRLDPETQKTYQRIMALHLKHRDGIFASEIFPVGPEPNGTTLTGFQSHNFDDGTGHLVVYRELRGPEKGALPLRFLDDHSRRFVSLSDDSDPLVMDAGANGLEVEIDRPGWYRLYRYEA